MKTIQNMRSHLVLALIVLFAGTSFQASAQRVSVSFQTFYNELQPYGSWFNHADYGYVWAPDVDGDFTPYATNGYWTVTQYGNTWVSNYDWGWAPFHYGRWYMDDFYGWIWVPDTVWSPGWVVWRNGGGYYGWAPMSPGLHFSFSLNLFNRIPHNYWTFCSEQYVWSTSWYSYSAPRYRNVYIVNNTNYVNNYYVDNSNHYYCGPSYRDIHRVTGRPVRVREVEECNRPSQYRMDLDKVVIYRPAVAHNNNDKPRIERTPRGNNGNQFGWTKGHDRGHGHDGNAGNGNGGGNPGNGNGNNGGSGNGGGNSGNDNGGNGNGGGNSGNGNGGGNNGNGGGSNGNDGGNSGNGNGNNGGSGNGGNSGNDNGGNGNGGGNGSGGGNGNGNSGGSNGGNGNGGSGNGGGNNGHGNGDQDAPGNSDDNNNGENSENSGEGNSGNGNGGNNSGNNGGGNGNGGNNNGGGSNGNGNNGGRTGSYSKTFPSERNQTELPSKNEDKWSENRNRTFEQRKPTQWNGGNNRQSSAPRTMPERKVDSKRDVTMSFPRSGGSRENTGMKAPSRSNGGSGMNIPKSSSGSSRMSAPSGSRGSGGMSAPSRSGGSKGFSPKKK